MSRPWFVLKKVVCKELMPYELEKCIENFEEVVQKHENELEKLKPDLLLKFGEEVFKEIDSYTSEEKKEILNILVKFFGNGKEKVN